MLISISDAVEDNRCGCSERVGTGHRTEDNECGMGNGMQCVSVCLKVMLLWDIRLLYAMRSTLYLSLPRGVREFSPGRPTRGILCKIIMRHYVRYAKLCQGWRCPSLRPASARPRRPWRPFRERVSTGHGHEGARIRTCAVTGSSG